MFTRIETLRAEGPFARQESSWPGREDIRFGWTLLDRREPERPVGEAAIRLALHLDRVPVWLKQTHSNRIWIATPRDERAPAVPPQADGILTTRPDALVVVGVADCAPLFLVADNLLGVLHAGWRGVLGGILPNALEVCSEQFGSDPARLQALLGPCIGPCCFEVSASVAALFAPSVRRQHGDRYFVDMPGALLDQWLRHGGSPAHFQRQDRCTVCSRPLLHSFRRQRESGRNLAYLYRRDRIRGGGKDSAGQVKNG
jgi:YfiH family protein